MKLAFCLFRYYPFGGLERDFLRIAKESHRRGHSIQVFTMQWRGEVPEGFSLTILPGHGFTHHARCKSFTKKLAKILLHEAYDLVVGFNRMPNLDVYYAADVCYQASVQQKHGFWYRFTPRYRTYAKLEKSVFDFFSATQILLLSKTQQKYYQQYYHTPSNRFFLLPPGMDKARIQAAEEKNFFKLKLCQLHNINPDHKILLMVGSDFKRKGVDRALLALASLPVSLRTSTYLLVIGKGKTNLLHRLAVKLQIQSQVLFLGPRNDIGEFMLAADLLLHPAYEEAAGIVLLEALVAGLPVLTTDVCGYASHVLAAKAGLVVPGPFKQEILNEYLLQMLTSDNMRKDFSEQGRKYSQNTDLYSLPKRTVDLFEMMAATASEKELVATMKQKNFFRKIFGEEVFLQPILKNILENSKNIFQDVFKIQGQIFRQEKNRKTLRFALDKKNYFIKLHAGVGWKEIIKNLLQGRLPVLGAKQEWRALMRLNALGIPTMNLLGYGVKGLNPASLQSFVVTEELTNTISLENFCAGWKNNPPSLLLKRSLIANVANIAKLIHEHGINHRDFYLCHFLLDKQVLIQLNQINLYLIDLHRVQLRKTTPLRWVIKDLAGLYFSSMDIGLTARDLLRFIKTYQPNYYANMKTDVKFWDCIQKRAHKLYAKIHENK